jgi:hypothetical protein
MTEWLEALQDWQVATFIRHSVYVYPLVNAVHILSLALLIGTILPVDLRILGFFSDLAAGPFLRRMTAVSATGLALAIFSGLLLFSVKPLDYAGNPAFLAKIALVAAGVANALVLRSSLAWKRALQDGEITIGLRAAAALSLVIWPSALFAGRLIGFL